MERRQYQREWARRKKAACPTFHTLAGGRKSRAKKPPRAPGQCTACGNVYPQTAVFFVLIKNKAKGWQGWSAECRDCRNKRFRRFYDDNQAIQVARGTAHNTVARLPSRRYTQ